MLVIHIFSLSLSHTHTHTVHAHTHSLSFARARALSLSFHIVVPDTCFFKFKQIEFGELTPNVYAPARIIQLLVNDRRTDNLVNVGCNRSPSFQQILGPVARTIASLSPVGDKFPRYFERVAFLQAEFLTSRGTSVSFGGLGLRLHRFGGSFRHILHRRIINRILYAVGATLHSGLRLLADKHTYAGYLSSSNQFLVERSPGRSMLIIEPPRELFATVIRYGTRSS